MSAFKSINKSDVYTLPYEANKEWVITSDMMNGLDIRVFSGKNNTGSFDPLSDVTTSGSYETLVYKSINHYYYQFYSESLIQTQSSVLTNYFYDQTDQRPSGSYYDFLSLGYSIKSFPTGSEDSIKVLSLPRTVISNAIKPGSFTFTSSVYLTDDGGGNLYHSSSFVGNIIYKHGILVITNQSYQGIFTSSFQFGLLNQHTVYEKTVKCTILDKEFNYSHNPTLQISGSGILKGFATASSFTPYITAIGLYNDANELLAVAKMGQPVPTTAEVDYNIIIKMDW